MGIQSSNQLQFEETPSNQLQFEDREFPVPPPELLWEIFKYIRPSTGSHICKTTWLCYRKYYVITKNLHNWQLPRAIKCYQISKYLFIKCCWLGLYDYVRENIQCMKPEVVQLALIWACRGGRADVATLLITRRDKNGAMVPVPEKPNYKYKKHAAFFAACSRGLTEIVKIMLLGIDRFEMSWGLVLATQHGHLEIVKLLLPGAGIEAVNESIIMASKYNRVDILEILMNYPNADPGYKQNDALIQACTRGHAKILEMLLRSTKVDPGYWFNEPLTHACGNGHAKIVELLLADPRINPTTNMQRPMPYATMNGFKKIVELLLNFRDANGNRFDPMVDNNKSMQYAVRNDYPEILQIFLDAGVDPSYNKCALLFEACVMSNLEILKMLLADHRINPRSPLRQKIGPPDPENRALKCCCATGKLDFANILLESGIRSGNMKPNLIAVALHNGYPDIAALLELYD